MTTPAPAPEPLSAEELAYHQERNGFCSWCLDGWGNPLRYPCEGSRARATIYALRAERDELRACLEQQTAVSEDWQRDYHAEFDKARKAEAEVERLKAALDDSQSRVEHFALHGRNGQAAGPYRLCEECTAKRAALEAQA